MVKAAVAYSEISGPAVGLQLVKEAIAVNDARDVYMQQLLYLATGKRTATVSEELYAMQFLLRLGKDNIGRAATSNIRKRISQLKKKQHKASSQAAAPEPEPDLIYAEKRMVRRRVVGKKGLR